MQTEKKASAPSFHTSGRRCPGAQGQLERFAFSVPGKLPSLNDFIRVERANRFAAASLKRRAHEQVLAALGEHPSFTEPVTVFFAWYRPDKRTDKDNVAFAKKFVLDALQIAGVIPNDTWNLCTPYDTAFAIDKANPRTEITITTDEKTGEIHG